MAKKEEDADAEEEETERGGGRKKGAGRNRLGDHVGVSQSFAVHVGAASVCS